MIDEVPSLGAVASAADTEAARAAVARLLGVGDVHADAVLAMPAERFSRAHVRRMRDEVTALRTRLDDSEG